MKNLLIPVLALIAAFALGLGAGHYWPVASDVPTSATSDGERKILYWTAPMDPSIRRDGPGKSPMGMDLVPVYADEAGTDASGVVLIDPAVVSNLGVRTAAAERGVLSRRIETVGYVGYAEDTLHHVHTRADGWIEKLAVKATGDPVRKGQVLFELYSPTLVNAQEEFIATLNSSVQGLADASQQRLLALGVSQAEIARLAKDRRVQQRIQVFAQADGFIAHLGVREGIFVTPATDILSVAELDQVWVLAEVFERQAGWVQPGQRADVELDYLPGERWQGTVDYVYPELDEKTRTLKVRLRFDNADEVLRPNMFARVTIFGTESGPVVHVPRESLIRGGKVDRVVLALGDGRFRAQPVETGMQSGDRVEILRGVAAGEQVVTSGQFLIDSESNIDSALERFQSTDSHGPSHAPMPGAEAADESAMDHSKAIDHEEHPQ